MARNKLALHPAIATSYKDVVSAVDAVDRGMLLLNENSMIDCDRIDQIEGGRVVPQSINLETMTGNTQVISIVQKMLAYPTGVFFPGTLLRDFGGYSLPTMPVIVKGKIVREHVKLSGKPYFDDPLFLAEQILGREYADSYPSFTGVTWEEPLKTLGAALDKVVAQKRRTSMETLRINGLNVLPVICNDLSIIAEKYNSEPIDMLLHACSNYFKNQDEREERYKKCLGKMHSRGAITKPLVICVAEVGGFKERGVEYESFAGIYSYEKGRIFLLAQTERVETKHNTFERRVHLPIPI